MKRFIVFLLMLAVLVALPFSLSQSQTHWPSAGSNPTQTARLVTLEKMAVPADVVEYVKNYFPETTYVVKGMIFNQGSEGTKIKNNVIIDYDQEKALVWHTGLIDVIEIIKCNNVCWKASCPQPLVAMPDTAQISSMAPIASQRAATGSEFLAGFPGWFKTLMQILIGLILLLLALLLIYLLFRGFAAIRDSFTNRDTRTRNETSHPDSTVPIQEHHTVTIQVVNPPVVQPIQPATPPAPAPKPDRIDELWQLLKELLEQRKTLDEKIEVVKNDLRAEIGSQYHKFDEINELLK